MTSKPTKKTVKKKSATKKAPAKKVASTKTSAAPKTRVSQPLNTNHLQTVNEVKQQFVKSEDFLTKMVAEQSSVVRANDVKSMSLRKRMLAWFRISK